MFFALGRLVIVLLFLATILYVCLWFYARSAQRERLEREWNEQGRPGPRDTFIETGMESERYDLQRKLLLGVYVIPFAVVAIVIYVANYA